MDTINISQICKALSDHNRIAIIEMLSNKEKYACKILDKFNITQPTLSHHMKILTACNLVNVRKEGRWNYYTLNEETLGVFQKYINDLIKNEEKIHVNNI